MKSEGSMKIPKRGWRCPSEEKLAAYVDGSVSEAQRRTIEQHLADCDFCLKSVAGDVWEGGQAAPRTPAWLRQKAEALVGQDVPKTGRWAWTLAPVLVGLLVVAVWVESPRKPSPSVPPRLSGASPGVTLPQTGATSSRQTRSIEPQLEPLRLLVPSSGAIVGQSGLQFEWTSLPHVSYYHVRVTRNDGELVWEARSVQSRAQAPSTLKFAPGSYFVWVACYLGDGRKFKSLPVAFRVSTER